MSASKQPVTPSVDLTQPVHARLRDEAFAPLGGDVVASALRCGFGVRAREERRRRGGGGGGRVGLPGR